MTELSNVAALRLPNAPNFRDLGGIQATDGRRIAAGRIYRSEALLTLDVDEWRRVGELGIRVVCDLRSPGEREKHPVRWHGGAPRLMALPILADVRTTGPDVMRRIASDVTGQAARDLLVENYASMPAAFGPGLGRIVEAVVDRGEVPLLISCMAGKDRTGFASALLLLALGVSYDDVVADYVRSNEAFDPVVVSQLMEASLGEPLDEPLSDAVLEALTVQVEYLDSALATIVDEHGSITTYLEDACGLDCARRAALRDALLT